MNYLDQKGTALFVREIKAADNPEISELLSIGLSKLFMNICENINV